MDKFRSYLDSLNTTQLTNNTLCMVDLTLSSSTPSINVHFYGSLTGGKRVDGETRINTVFDAEDSRKKEILATNSASYACSGPDGCEKEFLLKYVKWIIQTTFEEFKQVIRSLMANETAPKGRCVHNTTTVEECAPKICEASVWNNGKSERLMCPSQNGLPCYLDISTSTYAYAQANDTKEKQQFRLRCNYNDCNSQTNIAKVKHAVETYYNTVLLNGNTHNDRTTTPSSQSIKNDSCTVEMTWIVLVFCFIKFAFV